MFLCLLQILHICPSLSLFYPSSSGFLTHTNSPKCESSLISAPPELKPLSLSRTLTGQFVARKCYQTFGCEHGNMSQYNSAPLTMSVQSQFTSASNTFPPRETNKPVMTSSYFPGTLPRTLGFRNVLIFREQHSVEFEM